MTMAMQKRNHVSPAYGVESVFNNIFNNTLRRFFDDNLWDSELTPAVGSVPVNVRENENQYEVDVIAPGCRKENFKVNVNGRELTISFDHRNERKADDEKKGWVRNEYIQRSFSRSFTLDDTVDTAAITATYTDGILHIILPKLEDAKPKLLTIDVK